MPTYSEIDKKVDIYAYAITMYEVIMKKHLFHEITKAAELIRLIREGSRPTYEPGLEYQAYKFPSVVIMGWAHNPNDRPSINDIIQLIEPELSPTPTKLDI